MIVVITTLHKKEDALRIGNGLLKKRLIACYNLWPIESAYWWKGKIEDESETMMILKSQPKHFESIAAFIKKESGYEVPDIFSIDADKTDALFNKWVEEETKS